MPHAEANDGIYRVFAAKRVGGEGTVWAFEPSARELSRLRYNLELNHLTARIFRWRSPASPQSPQHLVP